MRELAHSSLPEPEEIQPNTVKFGWLLMCADLWEKLKQAFHNDWLSMVLPSIFTKTFGRLMMVLQFIYFKSAGQFILLNLKLAAWPIALISGTVVGAYRYFEARNNGKNKEESFWVAASFFIKTAVKFFVVYMGWVSAMALVNAMGWFSAPITIPALIILGSAAGGLALSSLTRWLLGKFNANQWLITFAEITMVASVFAIVAGAAYFLSPLVMALLVVGGITALALFFASLLTDVLPDPQRNFSRAWGMLARAYTEGAVWAFVEHIGLSVVVGGIFGGILDVFCVAASVCMAIFVGGQIDEHFKYLRGTQVVEVAEKEKQGVVDKIKAIEKVSPKNVVKSWGELRASIIKVKQCSPKGAETYLDDHIKNLLGSKVLSVLDDAVVNGAKQSDVDKLVPESCLQYITEKTVFFMSLGFSVMPAVLLLEAKEQAKKCLQEPNKVRGLASWSIFKGKLKDGFKKQSVKTSQVLQSRCNLNLAEFPVATHRVAACG